MEDSRVSVHRRLQSLRHRGYVGPRYIGVLGKLRLLKQGLLGHIEIVSYAEPGWWPRPTPPNPDVSLRMCEQYEDACAFLPEMERAYARDFTAEWRQYFDWGQTVALAFVGDKLASFVWLQDGRRGAKCHFIRLQPGEYRVFRGGVLPQFRSRKVQSTRHILVLDWLFSRGAVRVYVDVYEDNVYSLKAQRNAGYREFGRIQTRHWPPGRTYVRWL